MVNTVTVTDVTGADIVAHLFEQARKAAAYDALVTELTAVRDHLDALSETWQQASDAARIGRDANTRKDSHHAEFARGRSVAYGVAADKVNNALSVAAE